MKTLATTMRSKVLTEWHPLGYGTPEAIRAILPRGDWLVVRDDDAAAAGAFSCWLATDGRRNPLVAVAEYEADGGTVSAMYQWRQP